MQNFQRIIQWFIFSSRNPEKVSTTVKGVLVWVAAAATVWLGIQNIPLDQNQVTLLIDATINLVQELGKVIGAGMVVVGMIRKIFITAKGTHPMGAILNK